MQSGRPSVPQQQENPNQQQTPPSPLTKSQRIQLIHAGRARRNKIKTKRLSETNLSSAYPPWAFPFICGVIITVGLYVQYLEFWHLKNIDVAIDYKVPLFYTIELVFSAAGIHAFGRPYGPIIVQMLGLGVMIPIMVWAPAYEEWVRRTILLFSFMALLFEHRRTLR